MKLIYATLCLILITGCQKPAQKPMPTPTPSLEDLVNDPIVYDSSVVLVRTYHVGLSRGSELQIYASQIAHTDGPDSVGHVQFDEYFLYTEGTGGQIRFDCNDVADKLGSGNVGTEVERGCTAVRKDAVQFFQNTPSEFTDAHGQVWQKKGARQ